MGSLQQADIHRFVQDLQALCGEGATITKLTNTTLTAHIVSPITNFLRVRAEIEAGAERLMCAGFPITSVEPGEWIIVDTSGWLLLDELASYHLVERFHVDGFGGLLAVLLPTTMHAENAAFAPSETATKTRTYIITI